MHNEKTKLLTLEESDIDILSNIFDDYYEDKQNEDFWNKGLCDEIFIAITDEALIIGNKGEAMTIKFDMFDVLDLEFLKKYSRFVI